MFELTTQELLGVSGGGEVVAGRWLEDGDYWVRYSDGSVQQFSANEGVTIYP